MKELYKFRIFLLFFTVGFLFSCVPQHKLTYLQDIDKEVSQFDFNSKPYDYKLQPGDYLFIRIMSLDEKTNLLFNNITGSVGSNNTYFGSQNLYLTSYMVNDSGIIAFPILGRIKVSGLSVHEIELKIHDEISQFIREAHVVVKQVNYLISVLGEVNKPGQFNINNDKINIFEAISMAGDLTTFANRNTVKIIRHRNEKIEVIPIDLTKKNVLESATYYLQPNDVVYVEPLKSKQYTFATFPYSIAFSAITTLLVIITYLK